MSNQNSQSDEKLSTITTPLSQKKKTVRFSEKVEYNCTYTKKEYDRSPIYSTIYLKCMKRITPFEWRKIFVELNKYKLYEMEIHPKSKGNIQFAKLDNFLN